MNCEKCGSSDVSVVDSRKSESGEQVKRGRRCNFCGHKFITIEITQNKMQESEAEKAKLKRVIKTLENLIND